MASPRFSGYPSFRSMTVAELLLHFRSSISRGTLHALEERDALWSLEIDALRAHCRTQDAEAVELLGRINWLEEELSKQTSARKSLEENNAWLKRRIRLFETNVSDSRRDKKEELDRLRAEKADLEAKLQELERQQLAKHKDLALHVKPELQAEVSNVEREKNDEIRRITDNKKALEKDLHLKIEALEKEKRDIEAQLRKKEAEKSAAIVMIKRMEGEVKALRDESFELVHTIDGLKREKRDMEIEFRKTESAKSTEMARILNEKMTLEVLNEGMKEKISELAAKNEVLEREMGEVEAQLCQTLHEKIALGGHKSRTEAELKDKISQLAGKIGVLEKERGEMEAKFLKTKRETSTEFGRMKKEKMASEAQKRRAEECVKVLEKANTALEDEFYKYRKGKRLEMEEKNKLIKKITQEKTTLEAELRKAVEDSDEAISKFVKRNEVLVRQKDDMEAELWKGKKDKIDDSKRISNLEEALEDQKKQMEDAEKRLSKILKAVGVLEREKEALDAKETETSEEICSILKEKMDLEAQKRTMEDGHKKKVLELNQMIEALKKEKMEMGATFCQANKVNSEEIKRILKEKMDLEAKTRTSKEEGEKKILELADRIGILERETRGLAEEIMQKDEVIQVLAQENDSLENMKRKLKTEIDGLASKLKQDVNLFQPVHHPSNVDMLRTPLQNQGQKSVGSCKRKRANADACKRKRHSSEDLSGGRISDIENASSGGDNIQDVSEKLASCGRRTPKIWEVDQDLLDAFHGDPELCLEAVCALYRKHKLLLSNPTSTPLSLGAKGLNPDYSSKVIALAEYLIDEDPEGRMKKSAAELEQLEPVAVSECIDIAKQHYKQVFEIYKKKDDPFFLS